MSERWVAQRERGSLLALKTIHWIGVRLGRRIGRIMLYPITFYFLCTGVRSRRSSYAYLRCVLEREPNWRHLFRHVYCFAATILDRVYLLHGQFDRFSVTINNGALILAQVRSGQGAILLGSHLGSFEILRVLGVSGPRIPVKVLMNVDHNRGITRFMDALNPDLAANVIPIGRPDTLLIAKESIEQGFLIGALADRVHNQDKAMSCRFLGNAARLPAGPMLMAAVLRCPVYLFFGLYRGGEHYDIYFEKFAERVVLKRQHRERDLQDYVQAYADRLQHYVRLAPYNWFNFYDFWTDETQS